jgi:TonB family protein
MGISPREAAAIAAVFLFLLVARACPDSPRDGLWGDRFFGQEEGPVPSLRVEEISDLDMEGDWSCRVDSGEALATLRHFPEPNREGEPRRQALGIKVEFLSRAKSSAYILASRPIALSPRCVMLSVRALGRNCPHELSLVVLDYYGRSYELSLGRLDFTGWKRMTAYVPRFDPATGMGIAQDDGHYERPAGMRIVGLRLDFDPEESRGSYYAYFDGLEATIEGAGEEASEGAGEVGPVSTVAKVPITVAATKDPGEAGKLILSDLSRRIGESLTYPDAARRRGIEGTVLVAFIVDESGALVSSSVERSSDSDILDRAALDLLKRVFPVENAAKSKLSLRISIGYSLSGSRAKMEGP